jgi:hypothetical protein
MAFETSTIHFTTDYVYTVVFLNVEDRNGSDTTVNLKR